MDISGEHQNGTPPTPAPSPPALRTRTPLTRARPRLLQTSSTTSQRPASARTASPSRDPRARTSRATSSGSRARRPRATVSRPAPGAAYASAAPIAPFGRLTRAFVRRWNLLRRHSAARRPEPRVLQHVRGREGGLRPARVVLRQPRQRGAVRVRGLDRQDQGAGRGGLQHRRKGARQQSHRQLPRKLNSHSTARAATLCRC